MRVFHASWNGPETVFHEMPWKKSFSVYPYLNREEVICKNETCTVVNCKNQDMMKQSIHAV